jgi:hypothetical protein
MGPVVTDRTQSEAKQALKELFVNDQTLARVSVRSLVSLGVPRGGE